MGRERVETTTNWEGNGHQVYRRAMMIELRQEGLGFAYLKHVLATFALREVSDAMTERLKGYLRHLGFKLGLLADFHGTSPTVTPVRIR